MPGKGFFITGTDTGVGKTRTTLALIHAFQASGYTAVGLKPVASGCIETENGFRNEDAVMLQAQASMVLPYDTVNPYAYLEAVSPHLAGAANPADTNKIAAIVADVQAIADIVLVEGAGGWLAPINIREDIEDLAVNLALPVIVVVALRLGCINHAKLTFRAVRASGLVCAGWVACCSNFEMRRVGDNIQTLLSAIDAPLLGVLPYREILELKGPALFSDKTIKKMIDL
ncbi:MAG: dethiobiotin synthase [Gammaproteobacteria bacterium]